MHEGPALAGLKEPWKEAVLRTKILLEAGFLSSRLGGDAGAAMERAAGTLLAALDDPKPKPRVVAAGSATLARMCVDGWRQHWKKRGRA